MTLSHFDDSLVVPAHLHRQSSSFLGTTLAFYPTVKNRPGPGPQTPCSLSWTRNIRTNLPLRFHLLPAFLTDYRDLRRPHSYFFFFAGDKHLFFFTSPFFFLAQRSLHLPKSFMPNSVYFYAQRPCHDILQ